MKKDIIQVLKVTAFALALTLGINYVMAWTGPTQSPPNGNVPAPINTGITNQVKDGGLSLNALSVLGNSIFSGNIGIGVTHPTQKLDVDGNTRVSGNIQVNGRINADGGVRVNGKTVIDPGAGWHRTYGKTGWYNGTYGGGWFMQDPSWIRAYGNKSVYTGGVMKANGGMRSSKYCDVNGNNCVTSANLGGSTIRCTWSGWRGVYGNVTGCYDDLYTYCSGGKVTNMRFGC